MRILLIDDYEDFAELLAMHCRDLGYDLDWAPDGKAALASGGGYDIVLLDLTLPDANAVDLGMRIREQSPGIPMLLLSADSPARIKAAAEKLSIRSMRKPFLLSALVTEIRQAVGA